MSEAPPILSDSSSSEPNSELDIAESIECVAVVFQLELTLGFRSPKVATEGVVLTVLG